MLTPVLEKELGVTCVVPHNFDTDLFGTFSGEIERKSSPLETARLKCEAAMELTNCDLAISSEGSFGPHPSLFFIPAADEILLFVDKQNQLEIPVREISTETNFRGIEIIDREQLIAFANEVGFPSHHLILKISKGTETNTIKGIQDWRSLLTIYDDHAGKGSQCHVETDMRAFCNPTRMKIIGQATAKLIKKIQSLCPHCQTPGFGVTDHKEGLPCSLCGFPTRSVLQHISTCLKCHYTVETFYPNGKQKEDPTFCDFCNP